MNTRELPTGTEVRDYYAQVRAALSDLPPEDLDELTGGLEADLAELASEVSSGLREHLGDPESYAAELRAAAGLPARVAGAGRRRRVVDREAVRAWWDGPRVGQVRALVDELRPVGWVLRGLVVAWVVAGVLHWTSATWLFAAFAVGVSIWFGRQRRPRSRAVAPTLLAANVLAALLVLPMIYDWLTPDHVYVEQTYHGISELTHQGQPVTNLYAYDAQGNRMSGVRIFDNEGRPLDIAEQVQPGHGAPIQPVLDADGQRWGTTFPMPVAPGAQPWAQDPESGEGWTPPMSLAPLVQPVPAPAPTSTLPSATRSTAPLPSPTTATAPAAMTSTVPVPTRSGATAQATSPATSTAR